MLTRLQVPAGKAIALAAMPSAVLMSMGLTPQLATASPRAEHRFKPGPCVSQPDEADQHADGKSAKDGKDKSTKDASQDAEKHTDQDAEKSSASPSPSAGSGSASHGTSGQDGKKPSEPSASPSPSASKSKGLLDPVLDGVDGVLGSLGGDDSSGSTSGQPTPSASATPSPSSDDSHAKATKDTKSTESAKDAAAAAERKAKEQQAEAKKKAEQAEKDAKAREQAKDKAKKDKDADGKEAYPCPKFDADAYKNAPTEHTPTLLPDHSWSLETPMLGLHGLKYHGIVNIRTHSGQLKKVLKFTASGVDIRDLHQLVPNPDGTTTHVKAREGSTSTFRGGTVTMYTEELKGNLLGIVPVDFSPKAPPPLTIPEVFFTDVTVTQAGQFGGNLTLPGMHVYNSG